MKIGSPFRDLALAQGLAAVILFLLIPLSSLFGPGAHPLSGWLHGLGATLTLLVATYTWHAYYNYARGSKEAVRVLGRRLLMTNLLSAATVVLGNWLYIAYQGPEGAGEWFKLHYPAGHFVVMEYKEFVSLLTLPFGTAAGVLLRRFGAGGSPSREARLLIGVLLTMMWLCLLIGFVFGMLLSRWKAV